MSLIWPRWGGGGGGGNRCTSAVVYVICVSGTHWCIRRNYFSLQCGTLSPTAIGQAGEQRRSYPVAVNMLTKGDAHAAVNILSPRMVLLCQSVRRFVWLVRLG